ncbi:MAG TPA: tetratricopeptide repeat protein [Firmicutes bacterium]|nr:tetratricopeptide repeat protein [Bacillota bacterium]
MECLYCHHQVVGNGQYCPVCGRDLTLYRKVIRTSNTYYNVGLEKAKVRDLSGAAVYLKKSLDLYKKNTDARNLLGLIYYEMGETVDALAEWVISKNLKPHDNLAAEYLKKLQSKQSRLNQMNQTLKKFNQALYYARHDSEDLALLQAKKVISMNPRFVKAYQLLGLLYLKKEEYAKAEKTIRAILNIDVNNTAALAYLDELKEIAKNKKAVAKEKNKNRTRKNQERDLFESAVRDESIVPTYREGTGSWATVLLLAVGLVVGVLFTYFLIFPVRERALNAGFNEQVLSYNEKISQRDTTITNLEDQINTLNSEKTNLENELSAYTGDSGIINEYNKLINVLNLRANGDYIGAMDAFASIDSSLVTNDTFQSVYNSLNTEFNESGVQNLYNLGRTAYDAREWETAVTYFTRCLQLQPDYPEVIFYMGVCYQNLGDWSTAVSYYNQLIDNPTYANTTWGTAARQQRGY